MKKLEGKVALITGGTSGIGLATAKLFAKEGAKVFVTGLSQKGIDDASVALKGIATIFQSDAGKFSDISSVIDTIVKKEGGLDILFLNAGISRCWTLSEMTEENFDTVMQTNLKGPWLAMKAAILHMRKGASIIVNTSIANQLGWAEFGVYSASKAGLRSLVRTAVCEFSPLNIRVNAISPGPIETPIGDKMGRTEEQKKAFVDDALARIPLKRFGKAEEVANVALFLASDDSSYIQGAEIVVDGGMSQI